MPLRGVPTVRSTTTVNGPAPPQHSCSSAAEIASTDVMRAPSTIADAPTAAFGAALSGSPPPDVLADLVDDCFGAPPKRSDLAAAVDWSSPPSVAAESPCPARPLVTEQGARRKGQSSQCTEWRDCKCSSCRNGFCQPLTLPNVLEESIQAALLLHLLQLGNPGVARDVGLRAQRTTGTP